MINALHLIWIIPVSIFVGMFLTALVSANKDDFEGYIYADYKDKDDEEWQEY